MKYVVPLADWYVKQLVQVAEPFVFVITTSTAPADLAGVVSVQLVVDAQFTLVSRWTRFVVM